MKIPDFIAEKAELLAVLMINGPVQINKDQTGHFSQLVWVTPNNLTYDELSLLEKYRLVLAEVAQHESGLMVWIMFPNDLKDLNTPLPKNPIAACSTNE